MDGRRKTEPVRRRNKDHKTPIPRCKSSEKDTTIYDCYMVVFTNPLNMEIDIICNKDLLPPASGSYTHRDVDPITLEDGEEITSSINSCRLKSITFPREENISRERQHHVNLASIEIYNLIQIHSSRFKYTIHGIDKQGRTVIDLINPETNESINTLLLKKYGEWLR